MRIIDLSQFSNHHQDSHFQTGFLCTFPIYIDSLPSSAAQWGRMGVAGVRSQVSLQFLIIFICSMEDRFHKAFGMVERQVSLQAFQKYILRSSEFKEELFAKIRESNTSGFPRFNIWRMLLEVIPIGGDWPQKKQNLEESRKRWLVMKEEAKTGVKSTVVKEVQLPKNPLMKAMVKTEKKEIDSDSFLNEQIKKDVDRTYQELNFFLDPQILKLLTTILFVWCKANPDVSYKQGMNELLASIVFVYFHEAVPQQFEFSNEVEEKYLYLNSSAHAEADIFIVFEKIMEIQKEMYKENLDSDVKGLVNPNSKNNSPILQRIIQIQDQKMKALDLELFRIIKLQDVKTKTFLLRWIRCLHTREFGLVNSLIIWDSIFLDAFQSPNSKNKHQYEFVDAMCLAMFIYLRTVVLTRETANEILQIYQKYPQLEGHFLTELVTLAWSVCDELRNLNISNNNQNSNSSWYEESGKAKNLGLMQRGGYADTFKKQETEDKRRQRQEEEKIISKQTEEIEKESNALFTKKSSQKTGNGDLFGKPKDGDLYGNSDETDLFSKPKDKLQKVVKKQSTSPIKVEKRIILEAEQVRDLIETLKQSISLNEDIESRALASRCLKILEGKLSK